MPFDGRSISETARRLITAREYLVEHGWCQGAAGANGKQRCTGNALDIADGDLFDTRALSTFMRANMLRDISALIAWNDAPERTFDDVLSAFDAAIASEMVKLD